MFTTSTPHQVFGALGRAKKGILASLTAALLLGGSVTACAATDSATDPSPSASAFSPERLARIDQRMNEAVEAGVMAGGHGLIARHGEIVYEGVWGMADREQNKPMERDALHRIYSMSKPITAVALLMLYEEGHFLLEDPVARYLPTLAKLQLASLDADGKPTLKAPGRQPTIRDLLRHTAGLSYGIFSDTPVDKQYRASELLQAPDLDTFMERLGKLPLLLEPGTRWHYSVAVDVQGALVEAISGQAFGEFLQTRLFAPLGMDDTFFVVPENKRDRLTQLYAPLGSKLDWNSPWVFTTEQRLEPADPELSRNYLEGYLFESGGGGLVSTADDYLRFAQMLANEGELNGTRILSPGTVELMQRDHIAGMDHSGLWGLDAFGLGVGIVSDQAGKSGELGADGAYGWGGAAGTLFWVDPENDLIGIFMVQSLPHQTNLSKKFRVMTYQALVN